MRHVATVLPGTFMLLQFVAVSAMLNFDINLDQPPEQRWVEVAKHYRAHIIDALATLVPKPKKGEKNFAWIDGVTFDEEYEKELRGMAQAINHKAVTVKRLKWFNMLYEMSSPAYKGGCSGVLWAKPNGIVMHGRNMDDFSGDEELVDWNAFAHDATFYRHGKRLMKRTGWPAEVGIHTGIRFGNGRHTGFSFEQNTREPNKWQDNMAAAGKGGVIFSLAARRIMETTDNFDTAIDLLQGTSFAAPQYFVLAGSAPYQGAVLTIDRLQSNDAATPPIQRVSEGPMTWYVVQTNDDITAEPKDGRRPLANFLMQMSPREITQNEENLMQFMHTKDLFNTGTLFSTVMTPSTGYFKSVLPTEAPAIVDGNDIQERIKMGSEMKEAQAEMAQAQQQEQAQQQGEQQGGGCVFNCGLGGAAEAKFDQAVNNAAHGYGQAGGTGYGQAGAQGYERGYDQMESRGYGNGAAGGGSGMSGMSGGGFYLNQDSQRISSELQQDMQISQRRPRGWNRPHPQRFLDRRFL